MAEPAFQLHHEDSEEENPKPQLGVIKGGGESTEPKRGHLRSVGDQPEDIKNAEVDSGDTSTKAKKGPALNKEQQALTNVLGFDPSGGNANWKTSFKGRGKFAARISGLGKKRGAAIGGGIAGVVLIGLLSIFSFLLPFKLTHIIENIEERIGQVPQYAIEQRLEYYMNRYLIMRTLESRGVSIDKNGTNFTYLGKGIPGTLYTNWQGAKLEVKMLDQYGYRLEPVNPDAGVGSLDTNPTKWKLVSDVPGSEGIPLDRTEARRFVRKFAKENTRWYQVVKRFHMRTIMKRYFGIGNWKPFERKVDRTRDTYFETKKAFKKRVVQATIGRSSSRLGIYLTCVTDPDTCSDKLGEPDVSSSGDDLLTTSQIDDAAEEFSENGLRIVGDGIDDEAAQATAGLIFDNIKDFGIKKILGSIIAGAGILDFFSNVVLSLENGTLSQIVYDRNAQQYVGFASSFMSGEDQQQAGEDYDIQDAQVMTEILDNFETSPVYRQLNNVTDYSEDGSQIRRDCNGDGNNDILEEGEVVCPQKKLVQNKTAFTSYPAWDGVVVPIAEGIDSTIGAILDFVNGGIEAVLNATGVTAALTGLLEKFGIDTFLADNFASLLNDIFGMAVSGDEQEVEAYDNIVGSYSVLQSSLGGDTSPDGENSIGGQLLTDEQVVAINNETRQQQEYEQSQQSVFARYVDPTNYQSLTGQAAMHMPSSFSAASIRASSILTPTSIFKSISNLFVKPTKAQDLPAHNPFDALQMGIPADHPIFTANNGEGMDPEEVRTTYQCDLPVGDRPQNKVVTDRTDKYPFSVRAQSDPCLLEKVTEEAGTMYFTGKFDEGIDATASESNATPTGNVKDLAQQVLNTPSITYDPGTKGPFEELARGEQASVPSPEAPAPKTDVAPELLQLMLDLSGQGIPIRVGDLTSKDHTSTSKHYVGKGLDIGNEEQANRIMPYLFDNREQYKLDELFFNGTLDKTLRDGQPCNCSVAGHHNHIHVSVR